MPKFRFLSLAVFGLAFALGIASCSQDTQGGESGALSLQLTIADDVEIDEVAWLITGGDMPSSMGGTIDTGAPGATASIEVFGLPPSVGKDYTITMEAVSTDDKTTCKGSEDFGIDVGKVTEITVMLNCKRPTRLGAVRVNGEFNVCAQLTKVVVSPLEIGVGYDIDVSAIAEDEEGDDIEYRWSNDLGAFGDPTARETTYTCGEVGTHDITITITDDGEPCEDSWTVPVECVDVDGVDCTNDMECDDQNDCTQDLCTEGSCLNPNEEEGATCDQNGGAVCDGEGNCVACNSNSDCDEGFVCNDGNACVPDVDCTENAECNDQNDCTQNLCTAGSCLNPNEEAGATCDQDGGAVCDGDGTCVECNENQDCDEICFENECASDPDIFCDTGICAMDDQAKQECVNEFFLCLQEASLNEEACIVLSLLECNECNEDSDCDTGDVCNDDKVCVPAAECAVDGDCPGDSNECTDAVCDAGTCGTSNNTNECDGGAGTCNAGVCESNAEVVYEQNFEGLDLTPSTALTDDGWLGFVNRFSPDGQTYLGGYVKQPGTEQGGLAAIEENQGGAEQGAKQLVIISDYNNEADQNAGNRVEANTFQERTIVQDDVGKTITFSFDAKRGNIGGASTANAFIKTFFDPGNLINFEQIDTTAIPDTWNRYSISLPIVGDLVGATLQFGFSATASNFEPSQVFYDNVVVTTSPTP